MTDLTPLIARVDAATGPDREIDAEIAVALRSGGPFSTDWSTARVGWRGDEPVIEWRTEGESVPYHAHTTSFPAYTASIDAALALVEAKLPSAAPCVGQNVHHGYWHARLSKLDDEGGPLTVGEANAPTPALALISALLRAMQGGA